MKARLFAAAAAILLFAAPSVAQSVETPEQMVMLFMFGHLKGHPDDTLKFTKFEIVKRNECVYFVEFPENSHQLEFHFKRLENIEQTVSANGKTLNLTYSGEEGFFLQREGQASNPRRLKRFNLAGHVAIVPAASLGAHIAKARDRFFETVCKLN